MNACIARGERPRLSGDSMRKLPTAEALSAFESYFSYAGRYTLRTHEGRPQVVHQVTMSLNPNSSEPSKCATCISTPRAC